MNNREKVIHHIKELDDKYLNAEIESYIEMDHDDKVDIADAFDYVFDIAESNQDRRMITKCRDILILSGGFCLAPKNYVVNGDVRFQYKGKKYDWPHSGGWISWINQ